MSDNNNESIAINTSLPDEKQRLLQLIIAQGILHDTEQHPVIARDGKTRLSWVMNFLAISLNAEHLQLAARQMLQLLEGFEGRQLATIGTAAVPLLSACILESAGKYNGLMVRTKRKAYGTASLIDGRINHAEPVIVIDDSIGSGTNMLDCIAKLEQAGLYVEGCACLVRFGYDSGYAKLVERGYRVVALFDNMRDISPSHPADWQYDPYPVASSFRHIVWDNKQLPDYLSPFHAIRQSIHHLWRTGKLLKPANCFNQPLDTAGGVWLSLRAQDARYTSQGRHGFWHFLDDTELNSPQLDISHVAWLFATHLQQDPYREQRLEYGAFGLSLFGQLEACQPGDFDPQRHALVLRSAESPWKMGGALPNMPGISSATHLLHHARFNNTQLFAHEPYQLYRHSVSKLIEPGAEWPYGGVSKPAKQWDEQRDIVEPLAGILLRCVQRWHYQGTWPQAVKPQYIPVQCQWLFLSVYLAGKQLACVGTTPQQSGDLLHLVKTAAQDERWLAAREQCEKVDDVAEADNGELYIRVALLSQDTYLGQAVSLTACSQFIPGQNAIAIQDEKRFALMLPEVLLEQQWDIEQLSAALYQKAGIAGTQAQNRPVHWHSYRSVSWHADSERCQRLSLHTHLPEPYTAVSDMKSIHPDRMKVATRTFTVSTAELITAGQDFLQQHQQADGMINSHYNPVLHQAYQQDALLTTALVLSLFSPEQALATEWQVSYQFVNESFATQSFLTQSPSEAENTTLAQAYGMLALLVPLQDMPDNRALIAQLLPTLQSRFNRHGQLPSPQQQADIDHYGIELYALLRALQAGFCIDTRILQQGIKHLVRYANYQATARQYPVLLQTFALVKVLVASGHINAEPQLEATIARLLQDLLQWQQPAGAFLPEAPQLSPVQFTVRALLAILAVGMVSEESLAAGLHYLRHQLIQPGHRHYFVVPEYAIGGIYSGLPDGCVSVTDSAQFLQLLRRVHAREAADD